MNTKTHQVFEILHQNLLKYEFRLWQLVDSDCELKRKLCDLKADLLVIENATGRSLNRNVRSKLSHAPLEQVYVSEHNATVDIDDEDALQMYNLGKEIFQSDANAVDSKQIVRTNRLIEGIERTLIAHEVELWKLIESRMALKIQLGALKYDQRTGPPAIGPIDASDDEAHDSKELIPKIEVQLQCRHCNKKYENILLLEIHEEKCLPQRTCPICGQLLNSKYAKVMHIKSDHPVPAMHICRLCEQEFSKTLPFSKHMQSKHKIDRPFGCEECEELFSEVRELKQHIEMHTHANRFHCDICDDGFPQKWCLIMHMRHHSLPNACGVCGQRKQSAYHLERHMALHTEKPRYLCTECGRILSSKVSLRIHMQRHTGDKCYSCQDCGKKYNLKASLRYHVRKQGCHSKYGTQKINVDCLECTDCEKTFKSATGLAAHRKRHTEERTFACKFCPKKFFASASLLNHMNSHTGAKPFQCTECDRSFGSPDGLYCHKRVHTGERYTCHLCDKSYAQSASLKIHLRSHTGKDLQSTMVNVLLSFIETFLF